MDKPTAEKPQGDKPQGTLFERMGGEPDVRKLVEEFYNRVLGDPELTRFFEHTPMDKLRDMQYEFFVVALDGPIDYTGRPLHFVHHGRGITRRHLARFLDHLLDTISLSHPNEQDVYDVISRINVYADQITGTTGASE